MRADERMKNRSDRGFVLESHTVTHAHRQQLQHHIAFFLLMRETNVAERYINKYIRSDNAISWSFHSCCRKCDSQRESRFTCKMKRATYLNATNIENIFFTLSDGIAHERDRSMAVECCLGWSGVILRHIPNVYVPTSRSAHLVVYAFVYFKVHTQTYANIFVLPINTLQT